MFDHDELSDRVARLKAAELAAVEGLYGPGASAASANRAAFDNAAALNHALERIDRILARTGF